MSEIDLSGIFLAFIASFLLGVSKSGLKGFGVLIITIMALVFGSKTSTGIILPLLIIGDIFAVNYYRKHVHWKLLFKIIFWILLGVLLGAYFGKDISEFYFKKIMSIIIIISIVLIVFFDQKNTEVSKHPLFAKFMGITVGLTTMVGNLSGVIVNFYFLSLKLPKYNFIATAAWLFFIANLFKLPFHIWYWKTISVDSITISLYLIPIEILGLLTGAFIVKKIKDVHFRNYIIVLSILGAIVMFFKS